MPYRLSKNGLCVERADTGAKMKCYDTHEKAVAYLQALEANVEDAGKSAMKIGARNNSMDKARIKAIHDLCCQLDPGCCSGAMDDEATESPAVEAVENVSGDSAEVAKKYSLTYIKSLHLSDDEQFMRDVLAIKKVGKDDIHAYMALYGSPQVEDLTGEYFKPTTDFWLKKFGYPLPLTWDHAQDKATKSDPIIGQIHEMGTDNVGVWYNAQLSQAHQYRKMIDQLIDDHVVGTSSDSVPQYVERIQTGKSVWLKRWPIIGGALTTTPCEPRMLTEGSPLFKAATESIQTRMGGLDSPELDALKRLNDVLWLA